ncbi:MAG: KOW domain-containing RNA-binding protein [Clostridia bacterium]|nr:KOW domain-containing RNA-binding protein [Clostridia bacterium]
MVDITVGTLVFSKAGRDKGEMFLTLSVENGYAYIADGDLRRVEKPKKKKLIHLQRTNNKVELGEITNSAVRKIVAQYKPV